MAGHGAQGVGTQTLVPLNFSAVVVPLSYTVCIAHLCAEHIYKWTNMLHLCNACYQCSLMKTERTGPWEAAVKSNNLVWLPRFKGFAANCIVCEIEWRSRPTENVKPMTRASDTQSLSHASLSSPAKRSLEQNQQTNTQYNTTQKLHLESITIHRNLATTW